MKNKIKWGEQRMKNTNIIDFFTKKPYTELSAKDYKKNDELTEKYGVYLGCLTKKDATMLRVMKSELDFKSEQINHLTDEWERLYTEQQNLLDYCLKYLNSDNTASVINKNENDIMISEDGHVWFIDINSKK